MTHMSANVPQNVCHALQDIVKQKKVSVAWFVRDAAEKEHREG